MIPAAFVKAHLSGGVLGLYGIVFEVVADLFSKMSNKLRRHKIIFIIIHTTTKVYTFLK